MKQQHAISTALLHFAYWQGCAFSATCPSTRRQCRIVLAEDDDCLRGLLADKLRFEGHHVRTAGDGEAAWLSLQAEPFDLLITDYEMPRLNGLDLLRRMRGAAMLQPTIIISGALPSMTSEMKALLLPGAAMDKPFSYIDLRLVVELLLHPPEAEMEPAAPYQEPQPTREEALALA